MWQKERISKSGKDEAMQCKEQEKEQRDKMERCFAHKLVTNTELRRIITHTRRATVQVNNLTTACIPGGKGRQEDVTSEEEERTK